MATALLLILSLLGTRADAQDITPTNGSAAGTTITGGDCGANFVSALSINGVPTCTAVGAGDFISNVTTTVVDEIMLFADTGGKHGKRSSGSGIAKLTSGVLSVVTAPSSAIAGLSDSQAFTNKTYEGMTFTGGAFTVAFGASGGTVAYLTATQTFTNKSLTTPTIGDFTNATHNHSNAAGGGTLTGVIFGSQAANCIWAGPDGSSGTSVCRAQTSNDLPQTLVATAFSSTAAIGSYGGYYEGNCASLCTATLPTTAGHAGATMAWTITTGSLDLTLDGAGSENVCDASGCALTKTYSATQSLNMVVNRAGTAWYVVSSERASTGGSGTVYPQAPNLRVSLESGVCFSVTDQTGKGTLYYTPASECGGGSYLALYSGSAWIEFTQAELTLSLTITSGKNYDVFACYNSGTPNLALSAAWAADGTRTDALALQNGLKVKSSDHTCLAVGMIRATGSNTTETSKGDAASQVGGKRFVWNRYVRMPEEAGVIDTTDSWDYATGTWRRGNNAAGNIIEYIVGEPTPLVDCRLVATALVVNSSSRASRVAIGTDSITAPATTGAHYGQYYNATGTGIITTWMVDWSGRLGLGYHYISWLEFGGDAVTNSTFFGDSGADAIRSGLSCRVQ